MTVFSPRRLAFGDSEGVWPQALALLTGALLTPRPAHRRRHPAGLGPPVRTPVPELPPRPQPARWSSLHLSRLLLRLLAPTFVPADAPVVIGLDDTIERRRGARIAARGISRDPVRSSRSFFVKTSGLRWLSLQRLVRIPCLRRRLAFGEWRGRNGCGPCPS